MREIKFRAWDKNKKQMCTVDLICFQDLLNRETNYIEGNRPDGTGMVLDGDFELMQFTGLTDKNGKEIYEGDIVKSNPDGQFDRECEVEWVSGGFILTIDAEPVVWKLNRDVEVIGNKYTKE